MKVAQKTDTHTIYQKRSGRYAVKDADRRWVNGEDKTKVLLDAGLIKRSEPKAAPAEAEPPAEEESPAEEAPAEGGGE